PGGQRLLSSRRRGSDVRFPPALLPDGPVIELRALRRIVRRLQFVLHRIGMYLSCKKELDENDQSRMDFVNLS
ncbi:hypothetical protein TNCT_360521, partial [Trichonephila clavata]